MLLNLDFNRSILIVIFNRQVNAFIGKYQDLYQVLLDECSK